jgi:3'(2'), 5'-bisphosphate nucleotidase / inositol polyphosphate 1-phosphatase
MTVKGVTHHAAHLAGAPRRVHAVTTFAGTIRRWHQVHAKSRTHGGFATYASDQLRQATAMAASAVAEPPTSPVSAHPTGQTGDLSRELEAACDAVRLASILCRTVQAQLTSSEKVEKSDDSPVTVADFGAQALVAWSLQRSLPDLPYSMVGEEDAAELRTPEGEPMLHRITELVNNTLFEAGLSDTRLSPTDIVDLIDAGYSEGGPVGRHWVLDPIDGTRGFVGGRQYAVCLGLLEDGEVTLGVLGCPNLPQWAVADVDCSDGACEPWSDRAPVGCLFAGRRGQGAHAGPLFESDGLPTRPVHCNDLVGPDEARFMESFEKRHSNHTISAAIAEDIGLELPPLRIDSQAKYGALSRGDAAIFMRFPPDTYREKIWDHAAGVLILEEAGGVVTDAKGNKLDFSQGRFFPYLNGGLVAATPTMHSLIMASLRKIRSDNEE